jgi:transposase
VRVREALGASLPPYIERQLQAVEQLSTAIRESERELERCAKHEPVAKALMTGPGVGPMTAVCFVATLDTRERFASAHHVQAYLGLTSGAAEGTWERRNSPASVAQLSWFIVDKV